MKNFIIVRSSRSLCVFITLSHFARQHYMSSMWKYGNFVVPILIFSNPPRNKTVEESLRTFSIQMMFSMLVRSSPSLAFLLAKYCNINHPIPPTRNSQTFDVSPVCQLVSDIVSVSLISVSIFVTQFGGMKVNTSSKFAI